jgi:DNA-binding NarL/FixJ family response regulator
MPNSGRVLVVDDNAVIRLALSGIIRADEQLLVVGEATNGEAALEVVCSAAPDVVCLDIRMPGMDGLAVLRRMRQEHPRVKVVIVTGESTAEVVKEALCLGAAAFIVKPFNAEKVLKAVRSCLDCENANDPARCGQAQAGPLQ